MKEIMDLAENVDSELQEMIDNCDTDDFVDVIEILARYNKPKYNKLKLCEELTELSELLLKSITKVPEKAPTEESIVEEVGDVIFRLMVFTESQSEKFKEAVEQRLTDKGKKLFKYVEEGKYPRGV